MRVTMRLGGTISCLWIGFCCGFIVSFCWSYHLVQSGDDATAKVFAMNFANVLLWGITLMCVPEIIYFAFKTFKNRLRTDDD